MSPFRPFLTDPVLRLAAMLAFLIGAIAATFAPQFSVLAVDRFGLGDAGFAVVLASLTLTTVAVALYIGIRTDQTASRRPIALIAAFIWVFGQVLMTLFPATPTFLIAHVLLFPIGGSLMGQSFALARLAASQHPENQRDAIMSTLRAVFAAPFVLVLPVWALVLRQGADPLLIYPACLVLTLIILGLIWQGWPRDGQTGWIDTPSGLSLRHAIAELAHRPLALRILALGAVSMGSTLYVAVIGLLMTTTPGRDSSDAALYVGLVAGLEVPFMLALASLTKGIPRTKVLLAGAAIYALHLVFMPILIATPFVWLLVLPAAIGGAATLTLPIAYMQDLLSGRPGTGSSLMSLQWLMASMLAAIVFAIATALAGYGLALVLGALVSVSGAALLHLADSAATSRPAEPATDRV